MIVLTGATGFLGQQILGRILVNAPEQKVALIVRPQGGLSPKERVTTVLENLFSAEEAAHHLSRISVHEGDVTLPNIGLNRESYRTLLDNASQVVHCAASTDLAQSEESAFALNVASTRNVCEFSTNAPGNEEAMKRGKAFLYHVSTAFVAGACEETMLPERLNLQVPFRNHYEASKAHAEAIIRGLSDRLSWCVLRPSVIVGDSLTGYTTAFNVIYIPAKYIAQGLLKIFPALPSTRIDVVPVDYVAEAVTAFALLDKAHPGETFHLCCGVGREPDLIEVIEALVQTVNEYWRQLRPALMVPNFVPLDLISRASFSLTEAGLRHARGVEGFLTRHLNNLRRISPFVPYLGGNPRFDTSETESRLSGVITPPPLFGEYATSLFRFCLDTNWGKDACSASSLMTSSRYIIPAIQM